MQFQLTLIQASEVLGKKNNKGGTYDQMELVFKRDGKVEAKAFPEFANKDIYPVLKGLEKDATYTVTTEKVGDFWKWLSIVPGNDSGAANSDNQSTAPQTAASNAASSRPQAAAGKVLGSNYETRDERQLRQKLIVAQSSMSSAIELFKAQFPKGVPNEMAVTAKAEQIYNWVFTIATKDISDIESDVV